MSLNISQEVTPGNYESRMSDEFLCNIFAVGNCDILDQYINEIGLGPDKLKDQKSLNQLKTLLLNCYHDLWLKRVHIPSTINQMVINKIVKSHFLSNRNTSFVPSPECDMKKLIEYFITTQLNICHQIRELFQSADKENVFIYICRYLAGKINTAKKLSKRLLPQNRFEKSLFKMIYPWEQIQFILAIFVYSLDRNFLEEEEASLYLTVLSRDVIIKHLANFLKHFESFNIEEEINKCKLKSKNDADKKLEKDMQDKMNKSNEAQSRVDQSKYSVLISNADQQAMTYEDKMRIQYPDLFEDYWLVKNIYSLNIIFKHIDVALSIDIDSKSCINRWILDRCLLLIGEFTKCTPESPHLSDDLTDLLSNLMPSNLLECAKQIRNDISHMPDINFSDKQLKTQTSKLISKNVQQDLEKMKDSILFLLNKVKYSVIFKFVQTIKLCETVNDMYQFHPEIVINSMLFEIDKLGRKFEIVSVTYIREKVDKLVSLVTEATSSKDSALIRRISDLISPNHFDNILFQIMLKSYGHHLSYLTYLRKNSCDSRHYKRMLDILSTNLFTYSNYHREVLTFIQPDIESLFHSQDKSISILALELNKFVNVDLKVLKGFKQFRESNRQVNSEKHSFLETQQEIDELWTFVIDIVGPQQKVILEDKLNKEKGIYNKITELFESVQELNRGGTWNDFEVSSKIQHIIDLIGNKDSDLDKKMRTAAECRKFSECLAFVKKKYKGPRKCKYENLVWEFMKTGKYGLEKKIRITSDFLNKILVDGGLPKLDDKTLNLVKEAIESKYLSVLGNTFEELASLESLMIKKPALSKVYAEMALIRILEVSHKFGGGDDKNALLTQRPDVLLYCGKSLRNYLAHNDIMYKILPLQPDLVLPPIATEMSRDGVNWLPGQNYFLRWENEDYDWAAEEKYYGKKAFSIVSAQDKMFSAVSRDDLQQLKLCIEWGADPMGTNIYGRNALQLAFDKCSIGCFQYLLERYPTILIHKVMFKSIWHNPYKGCMWLDITTLPLLIRMIDLILKFPCFSVKVFENEFEMMVAVKRFINSKFFIWHSSRDIVGYLHIFVYLGDSNKIKKFVNLGMHNQETMDINGDYPIHWAAALGYTEICSILFKNKSSLTVMDNNGYSPLDIALLEGRWETVVYLKQQGAVNYKIDPLLVAIMANQKQWIDQLLEMSAFSDDGCFNISLFGYALCNCDIEISSKLLSYLKQYNGSRIINFAIIKTKFLEDEFFYEVICILVLGVLCFIGKVDVVKMVFDYLKDNMLIYDRMKLDYKLLFNEYSDLDIFELNLFKSNSLLHLSCLGEGNNEEVIKFLIEQGADINEENTYNSSPLLIALRKKNEQISKLLIAEGANINLCTQTGFTPIHLSSMYGLTEVTKELLQQGASLQVSTKDTLKTPLHLASSNGHAEVVHLLISEVNKTKNFGYINRKDNCGNTALYSACRNGSAEVVQILLDSSADVLCMNNLQASVLLAAVLSGQIDVVNLIINRIPNEHKMDLMNSFTVGDVKGDQLQKAYKLTEKSKLAAPIFMAAELGCNDIVKLLITSGANVNLANFLGVTALHIASHEGHCDIINTLLDHGARVDIKDDIGNTPLLEAVSNNQVNAVSLLLQQGADVNLGNNHDDLPLHYAACCGFHECANLILPKTTNINVKNKAGYTPTMLSAKIGHFSMVQLLLEYEAKVDPNATQNPFAASFLGNESENTILLLKSDTLSNISNPSFSYLHCAINKNNFNFVEVLLQKGVSPNLINSCGFSALHIAALKGHFECVQILLKYKADIEARAGQLSFTALHLAILSNKITIVELLLSRGANVNSHGRDFETPLQLAAIHLGNVEMVKILLQNGAKLYLTGLHLPIFFEAVIFDKYDIVKVMLEITSTNCDDHKHSALDNETISEHFHSLKRHTKPKSNRSCGYGHYRLYETILNYREHLFCYISKLKTNQQLASEQYPILYNSISVCDDTMESPAVHQANTESVSLHKYSWITTAVYKSDKVHEEVSSDCYLSHNSTCDKTNNTVYIKHTKIPNKRSQHRLYKSVSETNLSSFSNKQLGTKTLVNMRDYHGLTALHLAAATGNLRMGKLLISAGADCAHSYSGLPPIGFVPNENREEFLSLLCSNRKD